MRGRTNKGFFELRVSRVEQLQSGLVLLTKISYADLAAIHRLTERQESDSDPYDSRPGRPTAAEPADAQRHLDPARLREIARFVSKAVSAKREKRLGIGLFPSSLILALTTDPDFDESVKPSDYLAKRCEDVDDPPIGCILGDSENTLFVPKTQGICLIVDGQHRFCGVQEYLKDAGLTPEDRQEAEHIELIATVLLDFDEFQIGEVFANVNFKQKPVNRSLYYDILGSLPNEALSDLRLAHDLVLHLNANASSVLRGMVRLLGRGPGLVSQAFIVGLLLRHFRKSGVWQQVYANFVSGGSKHRELPAFMRGYFAGVKKALTDFWPEEPATGGYSAYKQKRTILCKTTGMGALLLLVKDVYPLCTGLSEQAVEDKVCELFGKISQKEAARLFAGSEYTKGGGAGLQSRLYKELKTSLKL
jgi:DGQHR domain-containing protein